MRTLLRTVLIGLLPAASAAAQQGSLFESVVSTLAESFHDEDFRREQLPGLAERYRPAAHRCKTLHDERVLTQAFLSNIPASHLGLLSERVHETLFDELAGNDRDTFGFELKELDGKYYAHQVLEGGPAARAGLQAWDRVRLLDGELPERSPRLEWRSDDAFLPDPPVHALALAGRPALRLEVERRPGLPFSLLVRAEPYSAWRAARASRCIYELDGLRVGYVHLWYVHLGGMVEFLRETLGETFAACDAVVLDLRGRGGNGSILDDLVDLLEREGPARDRPLVALIDRGSRSAKEIWAFQLRERGVARLVGERTAGAVLPALFAEVGFESVLMYPAFALRGLSERLEGRGVAPDVLAEAPGPYADGVDPILDAGLDEAVRAVRGE